MTDRTTIFQLPTRRQVKLTDYPRNHLVHCLRKAATAYEEDAREVSRATLTGMPQMVRMAGRLAAEARELADRIEAATSVTLGAQRKWEG